MAVRQYVGARYVTKFADPIAWQANTAYEALTIVTYNNSSYTSKIPVPATVGNPAENSNYWVITGNYNAQVEDYRQTTLQVQEQANENASNLANEIQARENADTTLQTDIDRAKQTTIIIFGDSWTTVNSDDPPSSTDPPIATTIMKTFYDNVYNFGVGGTNFSNVSGQVSNALTQLPSDINNYQLDVLLVTGLNEVYWPSASETSQAVQAFDSLLTAFPKANIYYSPSVARRPSSSDLDRKYNQWLNNCINQGIIPLYQTIWFCMGNNFAFYNTESSITEEHNVHLSADGYRFYYRIIRHLMHGGNYNEYTDFTVPLVDNDLIDMDNSVCHVVLNSGTGHAICNIKIKLKTPQSTGGNVSVSIDHTHESGVPFLLTLFPHFESAIFAGQVGLTQYCYVRPTSVTMYFPENEDTGYVSFACPPRETAPVISGGFN